MLLNRINYKNFRPFIGEQKIELTTSKNKNVIVLLGNNTAGKTTFVLSFVWCLYGESKFNKKDSILNQKIFNQMQDGDTEEAYVEINFSDNNKQYIVRRCQKFRKENNALISAEPELSVVYTDIEGKTYSVNSEAEKEDVIRAILPHDLSPYFFFEGEKDNKMNKGDLGDAVRNLLGLKAYDNMKKHLFGPIDAKTFRSDSVLGMLNKKILDTDSEEVKRTLAREAELEERVTGLQNDLKICVQNRESYKNKINEITDKLRKAEPSKNIQEFIDNLEKQIAKDEGELKTLSIKYLKTFGKESIHLLIKPLLSKVDDRLKVLNIADKGIRGLEASAITSLLNRGKCLCGTV